MIQFLTISALSLALVGACSKKKDDKPAEPAQSAPVQAEATVAPTAPVLVIKAAKLTLVLGDDNPDGPESIALDDQGHVVIAGETVATLSSDGKVVDKEGKEVASLAADGTLRFPGEEETAIVGADGSLMIDGEKVASFGPDNVLVMPELSEKVTFEGPEEARRAMMVVFMVATMAGDVDDSEATAEASAEAPTEE